MGAYKYLEEMWRPKLSAELPQSYQDRGWLLFSTHKSVDGLGMVYDWVYHINIVDNLEKIGNVYMWKRSTFNPGSMLIFWRVYNYIMLYIHWGYNGIYLG
jgi:hypothetical protein